MLRRILVLAAIVSSISLAGLQIGVDSNAVAADEGWISLFNGTDLTGWDTWLGVPDKSVQGLDLKKNDKGNYIEPVGLNKDPKKVYSVATVDGEPAILITGEIFGAIVTKEEYQNYHFRLEFKWGERKWAPRDKAIRDSGILYHSIGDERVFGGFWLKSQECQVQEHDCGDYIGVMAIADVEGEKNEKGIVQYKKGGQKFAVSGRAIKASDNEKPHGEWNAMEVLAVGDKSVHVVNGKPVMVLTSSRHRVGDKEEPLTNYLVTLTKGKIQIQSEGAEVYYRKIALKRITEIPAKYLP